MSAPTPSFFTPEEEAMLDRAMRQLSDMQPEIDRMMHDAQPIVDAFLREMAEPDWFERYFERTKR